MMTTKTKTPKPAYKPEIMCMDLAAGHYTVSSEKYRYVLYQVNVKTGTCTCDAARWGRVACKHRALVAETYALATSCIRTGAVWQTCLTCGAAFYGVPGANFCECSSNASPHAGSAAELLEAFGVE